MASSLILLVILTALNAVFASAEIAVLSTNEGHLKMMQSHGDKRARRLLALTKQPARFLATIQVAITLAGLLSSAFAAENFAGPLTNWLLGMGVPISEGVLRPISLLVITVILAYFNLIFGELVPKRVAMKKAESLSLKLSGLLYFVSKCAAPLVALLTASTNGVLRLMGLDPNQNEEEVSEEDILLMLSQGRAQGVIKQHEDELIQNIFEFDDTTAEQLCTHRTDLMMLDLEDFDQWEETIRSSRYTYYPIYQEEKDDVIGILSAKKYFRLDNRNDRAAVLEQTVTKPLFLLKSMKADRVFAALQQAHQGLALLVDEHGGLYGMVTLHDLLEALVGQLNYEALAEEPVRRVGDNLWRVHGMSSLTDLERALEMELPTEEHETLNGMIYELIKRIPEDGEQFECDGYGLHIKVEQVKHRRVVSCLVSKAPLASAQAQEQPED